MNTRKTGACYEDMACRYLINKGYEIAERNFVTSRGEIDIIAKKDGVIVFCEVKYRRSERFGNPLSAVDFRKQKKISAAAMYYYARHGYDGEMPCRFDVIGIGAEDKIQHVENAFPFQL